MATWTLTARWLFPVAGPPLENGLLTVADDRIAAVQPRGSRHADVDAGNAALLPGFVNAHAHLDLSDLRGKVPPSGAFTDWLRAVIDHRRSATVSDVDAAIRGGLEECLRTGTTLIGDVSAQGSSWPILAAAPLRAVVFHEFLGLTQPRAELAAMVARDWLTKHPPTANCRPALSPHAPYSVRTSLYGALNHMAQEFGTAVMTHLAETREELILLARHDGPFHPFLRDLGVWDETGLVADVSEVWQSCSTGGVPTLLAHGNYLNPADPLPANLSIVYCPRTHAAFGQAPHPFRDFLARGVRVALGTDGLSSNPDLGLLAEARFLRRRYPSFPGAALLRMLTLSGAEALTWQQETGSLEGGKSADVVVLPLPEAEPADPHELIFDSTLPIRSVLWSGRWRSGGNWT
jgi:cytosine/adenosine deaminase-related metal-dependent hydrolase